MDLNWKQSWQGALYMSNQRNIESGFSRLILVSAIFMAGCTVTPQWDSEMPYVPAIDPKVGDILHAATGHYLSEEQMFANLAINPLVYVGEEHDNLSSHALQLKVLMALMNRHPGQVALGMEMFTPEHQPALDQWVAGDLTEKEFLRASKWYEGGWGSDFDLYADLLEYCRDKHIPIIGLNIDRELGRKVSMTPLADIDQETRDRLPEMDMQDPYHSAMVQAIFGDHAGGANMLASFRRRQNVWDEAMAQSVADYMQKHADMHLMVIAGGWHINYDFGIPRRVFRRHPIPYVTIGGKNLSVPEEVRAMSMHVDLPRFPMTKVDYLVFQDYKISDRQTVSLGVMLEEAEPGEKGAKIKSARPGSAAAVAGIVTGQRIVRFSDSEISDNFDLVYAVKQRAAGDRVQVVVRDETEEAKERTIEVVFP
jgi:uncharacterized iron-regulated protein